MKTLATLVLSLSSVAAQANQQVLDDYDAAVQMRYMLGDYQTEVADAYTEEAGRLTGNITAYRAIGVIDPVIEAAMNDCLDALFNGNSSKLQQQVAGYKLDEADAALVIAAAHIDAQDWTAAAAEIDVATGKLIGAWSNLDHAAEFNGIAADQNDLIESLLGFP